MKTYQVAKLSNPKEQVGLPNTQKWAVYEYHEGFVDAFRTKAAAQRFVGSMGGCLICGEDVRPCKCEREAAVS